jgi:phage regulator Rha-like protein
MDLLPPMDGQLHCSHASVPFQKKVKSFIEQNDTHLDVQFHSDYFIDRRQVLLRLITDLKRDCEASMGRMQNLRDTSLSNCKPKSMKRGCHEVPELVIVAFKLSCNRTD